MSYKKEYSLIGLGLLGTLVIWPLISMFLFICVACIYYVIFMDLGFAISWPLVGESVAYFLVALAVGVLYTRYVYRSARTFLVSVVPDSIKTARIVFIFTWTLAMVFSVLYVATERPNLFQLHETPTSFGFLLIYFIPLVGLLAAYMLNQMRADILKTPAAVAD